MEPIRSRPEPNSSESSAPEVTPNWVNRRATEQAVRAANARRASGRRRFVDPTTCERDYSSAELEFMQAMQEYKQRSGRMFPTWSEVLEVLRDLGYVKSPGSPSDSEIELSGADLASLVSGETGRPGEALPAEPPGAVDPTLAEADRPRPARRRKPGRPAASEDQSAAS